MREGEREKEIEEEEREREKERQREGETERKKDREKKKDKRKRKRWKERERERERKRERENLAAERVCKSTLHHNLQHIPPPSSTPSLKSRIPNAVVMPPLPDLAWDHPSRVSAPETGVVCERVGKEDEKDR